MLQPNKPVTLASYRQDDLNGAVSFLFEGRDNGRPIVISGAVLNGNGTPNDAATKASIKTLLLQAAETL